MLNLATSLSRREEAMKRSQLLLLALLVASCPLGQPDMAHATITSTGNIFPDDPTTWTTSTNGYIGNTADGTIEVNSGSDLYSNGGYIGNERSASGEVIVSAAGSTWTNSNDLNVGYRGTGTLRITAGGSVSNDDGYIGRLSNSAGEVTVSGAGSMWTNDGSLSVGRDGCGTLTIADGGQVNTDYTYIGYDYSAFGEATVTGAGSTWTNSGWFLIGYYGNGTLAISDGGTVAVGSSTSLACSPSSMGTIAFGTGGGTLTTRSLQASPAQLTGTGTINTRGLMSDIDLTFDDASGLTPMAYLRSKPDQDITVNFDMRDPDDVGELAVGYEGNGSLTIQDGIVVPSNSGYIGYKSGSTGVATVTGTNSTWANKYDLYVGHDGDGTLAISAGGTVTVGNTTWVTYGASSNGTIAFGPGGGTLTTQSLWASPVQLTGTGTINTRGLVSDVALVFNSGSGATPTLCIDSEPDQNITVNLDMSNSSNVGSLGVGYEGSGTLVIRDGVSVQSSYGHIGYKSGSEGAARITGTDSRWNIGSSLFVGESGNGTLAITAGGRVNCNWLHSGNYIGYGYDSAGVVTVRDPGSTWDASNLYVGYEGSGTLAITAGGSVNSGSSYIGIDPDSSGKVTVSGTGSTWNSGGLYVGYRGTGTLTVGNGGTVDSSSSYIGYESASKATVRGVGATWTSSGDLFVGYIGEGTLAITDGGSVDCGSGYLGYGSGSTGDVTVSGAGSTWTNDCLFVGYFGSGTLAIDNGGSVTAVDSRVYNSRSLLSIEVNGNSRLTVDNGGGTFTNNGTVRLIAGAAPAAGAVYTPISAGTWTGSGLYQAVGGTWDEVSHEFTVSNVDHALLDETVTMDLANMQRAVIDNTMMGWSVGASFLATQNPTQLRFEASCNLAEIAAILAANWGYGDEPNDYHPRAPLCFWEFTASSGFMSGDPVYLSFDIGSGYSRERLSVWHVDGADPGWSDPADLAYDGRYASFTTTDFYGWYIIMALFMPGDTDGDNRVDETDAATLAAHWGQSGDWYDGDFNGDGVINAVDASILAANWNPGASAESSPVPEPSVFALLAAGLLGLLNRTRRSKGHRA